MWKEWIGFGIGMQSLEEGPGGRGEAVLVEVGWLGVGGELGEVLCRLGTVVVVYLEGKRRKVEAFQPMLGGLGR